MEKTSLRKRKLIFWLIQLVGCLLIVLASFYFSLSALSVGLGVLFSYANVELLFCLLRPRVSFFLLIFKYMIFFLILYLLKNYLDMVSFLVGTSALLFGLAGLSAEVIKYDSL